MQWVQEHPGRWGATAGRAQGYSWGCRGGARVLAARPAGARAWGAGPYLTRSGSEARSWRALPSQQAGANRAYALSSATTYLPVLAWLPAA